MSWSCPHCRGGFPEEIEHGRCPWCGTAIDGTYDPEEDMPVLSVTRSRDSERNKPEPLLQKLKRVFG